MSQHVQSLLLGLAGVAILAVSYRWQVIGVHSGAVKRSSNPVAYWIMMSVIDFGTVVSLLLATGLLT